MYSRDSISESSGRVAMASTCKMTLKISANWPSVRIIAKNAHFLSNCYHFNGLLLISTDFNRKHSMDIRKKLYNWPQMRKIIKVWRMHYFFQCIDCLLILDMVNILCLIYSIFFEQELECTKFI